MKKFYRIPLLISFLFLVNGFVIDHGSKPVETEKKPVSGTSGNEYQGNYKLKDYASWIDFDNGRWFTIHHLALPLYPWGDVIDRMANRAFRFLVTGDKSDRDYFVEKQLELAAISYRDIFLSPTFTGGKSAHPHGDRVGQELAEVYLAMRQEFTPEQQKIVEKWYHEFAWYTWNNSNFAERQGTKGGFMAVAGYMTGDTSMITMARKFLSFEDTWTIQEDARHYAGLIMERMFRIEIFSNQHNIPLSSKANLARQMRWVLSIFPHNGFNPAWGDCWIQNEIDHYMECLMMASFYLKEYDLELARECKWLSERMFEYGRKHFSYATGKAKKNILYSIYDEKNKESSVYKMQVNPIHLYWYVDETLLPKEPDIQSFGSKVTYRLRSPKDKWDRDTSLVRFTPMMDKIILRDSWKKDALFVMIDPVMRSSKNVEGGAGNGLISLSVGDEEFLTGKILNRFNHLYIQHSVSDIPSDPRRNFNAFLECFTDNPEYSQSVTVLEGWKRKVTLFKKGDRRVEVEDYLPAKGNVYWHLQGKPESGKNKVVLDVRGTKMEVSFSGNDSFSFTDVDTWNKPDSLQRWCYTGNPDRQLKLERASPGMIVTTFRPVEP